MNIVQVADPLEWDRWPEAERLLDPARTRGDFEKCIEPDEALLAVLDGDRLLACATIWHSTEGFFEVKLVGGTDRHLWLAEMEQVMGDAERQAGAAELRAWGRRGWAKQLAAMGWAAFPIDKQTNGYVKRL